MYITLTVKPAPSMDIQPSFNFETDGHAFMIVSSYILSLFGHLVSVGLLELEIQTRQTLLQTMIEDYE